MPQRLAAWRCGGLRKPKLSVNHWTFRRKTIFKLSLNPPYCQTAVMWCLYFSFALGFLFTSLLFSILVFIKVSLVFVIVISALIKVNSVLVKVNLVFIKVVLAFVIVLFVLIKVNFEFIKIGLAFIIVVFVLSKVNLTLIIVIYELQKVKWTKKNKIGR